MLVAIPLGLSAAIYLSEYASPKVAAILRPAVELLAGVPTVVFGYFTATLVALNLVLLMQPPRQSLFYCS
jgi:phosphate transport system permease protein